ncbi:MAG: acyl-CoA dehydrogenase family protein, partial [Myxococcota bacterium]
MDLDLSEEQRLIQKTARDFAQREVFPKAAELDEQHRFPTELVKRLGELGLMGIAVPEQYGGAGMDAVSYTLALEEIAVACASTAVIMSVNNSLVCDPILKFGSERQKRDVLAPLARGEKLGCFALSEPDAGSDAGAQKTRAEKRGGEWVLSGTKNFITNGPAADWVLLFAMTEPEKRHKGISAYLVPTDAPGLRRGPPDRKMGITAAHSCQLFLEDCRVPGDAILGEPGQGFKVAMATLDGGRIGIATQAIGIARAALEAATRYACERQTFGKPIAQHQAIQFMLADMATEIDAARLLTLRAATLKDRGARHTTEASMAKLMASEVANRAAKAAVQIHGGYGYLKDFPVERFYRDAKITE